MTKQELLEKIREAGVIGAGGAGFPTYKKLDARVEHLIANGAECEPLLYKDREVMLQEPEAFIRGLELMQQLTGASKVTIAVKRKNADVVDHLKPLAEPLGFAFHIYENVYPAGDEYVLVYEITGKQIPPGGIPLQVGCVVNNVETIVNIAHAAEGRPVCMKYLTVTGEVQTPRTMSVPVGSSIRWCIEQCGGLTTDAPVILTGGVMMGGVETDLDQVVTKTLGGIIVLPRDHYLVQRKMSSQETYTRIGHGQCDQCSLCTELCPRYILGYPIEPHKVMRTLLMTGEKKARASLWAQYCCECNVCSYIACPEGLDPKNICVDAKALLRENKMSRSPVELETLFRKPHPVRSGREIPIDTLYTRLGLRPYDRKAPWVGERDGASEYRIPLNSHIGAPCAAQVAVGDRVEAGSVLGKVEGEALGCAAHASRAGQVVEVTAGEVRISG